MSICGLAEVETPGVPAGPTEEYSAGFQKVFACDWGM